MVKHLTLVLFVISLAVLATRAEMEGSIGSDEQPSMMKLIQSILHDPEFLALNDEQQLRILIIIYEAIQEQFKSLEISTVKERDVSSPNMFIKKLTNA